MIGRRICDGPVQAACGPEERERYAGLGRCSVYPRADASARGRPCRRTEGGMWSRCCSMMRRLTILVVFETVGLPATTMAEPIEPHKVPTLTIRAQPAEQPGGAFAPHADDPAVQPLKVRPLPEGRRGASARRFVDDGGSVRDGSKADAHAIRTIPIGPDTDTRLDLDRHFAPRTSAPSRPSPAAE